MTTKDEAISKKDDALSVHDKTKEALKLADELDAEFAQGRISNHTGRKVAQFIREALMSFQDGAQSRSDVEQPAQRCKYGNEPVSCTSSPMDCQCALDAVFEQPAQQEPVSLKSVAQKAGISMPKTYIPTMDDAIAAGDSVLINEQAALLRECRAALDSLIAQKPTLSGLLCGSTTLGNLKAELGAYRPQGVFGTSPPIEATPLANANAGQRSVKPWVGLTQQDIHIAFDDTQEGGGFDEFARAIEAKLREKNEHREKNA